MEIRSLTFIWLNSFKVCVISRLKTLEHSMVSFFLTLESFNTIWGHLSEFENSVRYRVVNGDKVGTFGRSDDQTLFRNKSNLHTKRAFTHDIFRWNRKVGPVVSLSAIQWTTHSVFSKLAWQNVEIWRPKWWIWMHDAVKLPSLLSPPLGRELGTRSIITWPVAWRARNFWPYKLCLARLPVR